MGTRILRQLEARRHGRRPAAGDTARQATWTLLMRPVWPRRGAQTALLGPAARPAQRPRPAGPSLQDQRAHSSCMLGKKLTRRLLHSL